MHITTRDYINPSVPMPKVDWKQNRYDVDTQLYDVWDKDTGELLSVGLTMVKVIAYHGAIIEHLELTTY